MARPGRGARDAEGGAEYGDALEKQMGFAETIANGLGYGGTHFRFLATGEHAVLEKEIWTLAPAASVAKPATYNLSPEKRTTLDFAIDHLAKQAPKPQEEIKLGAGAPYGQVLVDKQTCTLCMACVGACPESALVDGRDQPMLKFIERNCVQCGLCEKTCPENAITLAPRLLLAAQAKQEVMLNEAVPYNCVRCGKPFGTRQMVDNMLGKAHRPLDVRGRRGAEAPPDVRRLPRRGHDGKQGRDQHLGRKTVSATLTPLKFQPPEVPRMARALGTTRYLRGFSIPAPTPRC